MRRLVSFIFCLMLLTVVACAAECLLPGELTELDPGAAAMVEPASGDMGLFSGLLALWEEAAAGAKDQLTAALKSGLTLVLGVVLLSAICHFGGDKQGRVERCAVFVGAMWILTLAAGELDSFLGMGRRTMGDICLLSKSLLPAMCSALAAGGNVVGASVRQVLAVFFSDLLVAAVENLLLPMLQIYLASAASASVLEGDMMYRAAAGVKKVITWTLSGILIAYTAVLTLCGAVAGSVNQRALRLARSALGTMVPVVGRLLSGAAETLLASADILKSTVGTFGALAVFGAAALPLLLMGGQFLLYRLLALCAGAVAHKKLVRLLDMLGEAYALLLAMTASVAVMVLISLVTTLKVVT